jgi:class 3 adenylate cyclase
MFGRIGPEFLAFSLNRYMEKLINIISKNGGDIFKFAGDALLVIWPDGSSIEDSCKRAVQCALDIQAELHNVEISKAKKLSIKIGLGQGEVRILFVGGQFDRAEYLIVGEAMRLACLSETRASEGGQTICHDSVYQILKGFFSCDEVPDDEDDHGYGTKGMKFYKIKELVKGRIKVRADAYLMRTKFNSSKIRAKLGLLKSFIPKAISIYIDLEKERWSKEIRMVSVMFMNLKVDLSQTSSKEGIQRIQKIVKTVQRCIYMTKGALNKFLMDDKGSVMLIVWGLPPFSEIDDPSRTVLSAMELRKELAKFDCGAYMGITTGSCFTGVCGTIGGRREYSLLGEVVNLSARHMQQAIVNGKKNKSSYEILLCEKTKNLIQNDIACEWVCEGECKGFTQIFQFYRPLFEIKTKYSHNKEIFLPQLRTHKNNFYLGALNEHEKNNEVSLILTKSIFMVSRNFELKMFVRELENCYKKKTKELFLIRGVFGSGKGLFVRKAFFEMLLNNSELKNKYYSSETLEFIFVSTQDSRTLNVPFNGFINIFKEIIECLNKVGITTKKREIIQNLGDEKIYLNCSLLGEILLETNCYSKQRYIEEILGIKFSEHISFKENKNNSFEKFFSIVELDSNIDFYFFKRNFHGNEKLLCTFFISLLKHYKDFIKGPLYFIIDDCQYIDTLSIEFIKQINNENMEQISIICLLQDEVLNIQKTEILFNRIMDQFKGDKIYVMDNVSDYEDFKKLITTNLSQAKLTVKGIDPRLLEIILKKSFKGNPLFILDIVDSMISHKIAKIDNNQILQPTKELLEMEEKGDYSTFPVPIRIEKLIGHILDCYNSTKELIILKQASVIGNIFSTYLLNAVNEFNSMTFDDLLLTLYSFEGKGILDVLYDINPQNSVFTFKLPFCREILYQRTLIEQKNDLHQSIARAMQKSKFSYMNQKCELQSLKHHLKISEKSLVDYIKEEDNNNKEEEICNLNNIKLSVLMEISHNIKNLENKFSNHNLNCIKVGKISKKSDKNISWEERYFGLSKTKLYYWYKEDELISNKMPLGYIELKHLYQVEILQDLHFGNKKNLFQIYVAQWYKKDLLQGPRNYILSCDDRETLYNWVITLNFMRVKALHDEFSNNFGIISLPMFANEKEEQNYQKRIKKKFTVINPEENKKKSDLGISGIYNNIARKSVSISLGKSKIDDSKSLNNDSLFRRYSSHNKKEINEENNKNSLENLQKLKDQFELLFDYSIVNFFGFIQDIIFNIENTGINDDKIIIPKHIAENIKNLPFVEKSDPYFSSILSSKNNFNSTFGSSKGFENNKDNTSGKGSLKQVDEEGEKSSESSKESLKNNTNKNQIINSNSNGVKIVSNKNLSNNQNQNNNQNARQSINNSVNSSYINESKKNSILMNKNLGSEEVHLDNEKYPSSNNLSPYKFNIDEEKVELKKDVGTIAVGKNLADFDLSFDEGVDEVEQVFAEFKKNRKKSEKISFKN